MRTHFCGLGKHIKIKDHSDPPLLLLSPSLRHQHLLPQNLASLPRHSKNLKTPLEGAKLIYVSLHHSQVNRIFLRPPETKNH
jgi:hypothetical protein